MSVDKAFEGEFKIEFTDPDEQNLAEKKFLECKLQGLKTIKIDEGIYMSTCQVRTVYNITTQVMTSFVSQP